MLKPNVELVISQFFDIPNVKPVAPDSIEYTQEGQDQHNDDVVKSIHEILEQRIKPFVERDGGDVEFIAFDSDTGVLQIRLVGSCAGCPKSSVTLKFGIQRMVCHYIPEVKNVINIEEPTEGEEEGVVNSVDPQASAEPKASPNPEASVNREASTEPEDSAKSQQA
ncbi:HIRA-interacting protein, putative [Perkinsus marinus ATCC 50983]|uniref:HIRA-interacting protein, putative n=1 Tax=Perkinsus marinus (strain ATCC 50983 / TXsc) TaxID=423536 RepID=C5KKX3_PERM5|nr:HIRA-interacting protein, putative [Perkinsus marinus ATCC 50983]EER14870.1 HIRA-interacting protein, putative [Perkinsus marinus ATCC 50983]|eukprot:XP_002783074.1 HIRA-interacting protein, putative [Perkinsus marinus ATCC 50983]